MESLDLENYRTIRVVLKYWFGQYEPDQSQKKLWMIASSSEEHRKKVDHEITEKFVNIITKSTSEAWGSEIFGYEGKIAKIVVMDQFSRHIHRHYSGKSSCPIPPQSELDLIAYETAKDLVEKHKDEMNCGMIPLPMIIFALMPFRHASTLDNVKFVQKMIEKLSLMETQYDNMVRRFRKATNRRMAILQDEARRTGNGVTAADYSDSDILETFPFDANMDLAKDHVVHRTISQFLQEQQIAIQVSRDGRNPYPVIVSLSGGVDSMVIVSVLANLVSNCAYFIKIYAVHIDYANRPESGAEASYVEQYCKDRGITFCLRRIDEVTRGITARDDYERIAREARYQAYRDTVWKCQNEYNSNDKVEVGVMLGHHRGDLRENVLSNSHKGCGPLDLSGMTAISVNDRVFIYRPLLSLEKSAIYDYAHCFGVPYFKDTTPYWSTRGKIRNNLLPMLQEIYGDGSMNNLSNLASASDDAKALMHDTIFAPFLHKVERKAMGIMFQTDPWKEQRLFFWKFVLRQLLHSASLGMFSDKSVESFLERIQSKKLREGWLQCRRDYAVYLRADGKVFVLFPDSFPVSKAEKLNGFLTNVPYGKKLSFGPWSISATIIDDHNVDKSTLLVQKAIPSWENFMDGSIEYYIEVPIEETGNPRELVFVSKYDKQSRPLAWKQTDLKLQATLPLLGNDKDGLSKLANTSKSKIVRVLLVVYRK